MAQTATPYGLYVRRCVGGRRNTSGDTCYPVAANVTGAMFYGAPLAFAAGTSVAPVAASPVAATPTCGLMQGARWIAADGTPRWGASLPANAYTGGARNIEVMVCDDPGLVMMVQASGTLSNADIGKVAPLLNFAAGNAATGRSIASLNAAAVAASGDLAVRIIGIIDPGAPFPDCLVAWVQAATQVTGLLADPAAVDPVEQQKIYEEFVRDRVNESREAQGLPPVEDARRTGETDKQYQERIAKNREEREARAKKAEKDTNHGKAVQTPVPAGHKGDK